MHIHCPRCRSRFQVPDEAAGKTATCANPQCGTKFVIRVPTHTASSAGPSGGMVPRQRSTGIANQDPTEITFQLATKPKRPSSVTIHTAQPSNSMGIVSLVVGILALLLCWLPMMNRLGYAIGVLGVVLGLFGLVVASQQRGVSIGFPVGGLGLSIVGLVLAFQMDTGFQKFKTAVKTAFSDTDGNPGSSKPPGARKKPGRATKGEPSEPKQWADATKKVLTWGDASVKVKSVRIGNATQSGINGRREVGPYLLVELRVTNRSENKKLDFKGWSNGLDFGSPKCSLVDEHGNDYAHITDGMTERWDGPVSQEVIAPRGLMTDLLIFEPPVNAAKELRLEIPAAPLGVEGWYRFSIPRQMWDGAVRQ